MFNERFDDKLQTVLSWILFVLIIFFIASLSASFYLIGTGKEDGKTGEIVVRIFMVSLYGLPIVSFIKLIASLFESYKAYEAEEDWKHCGYW